MIVSDVVIPQTVNHMAGGNVTCIRFLRLLRYFIRRITITKITTTKIPMTNPIVYSFLRHSELNETHNHNY